MKYSVNWVGTSFARDKYGSNHTDHSCSVHIMSKIFYSDCHGCHSQLFINIMARKQLIHKSACIINEERENWLKQMKMNEVLKYELLNNCISCDLYLLFTWPLYATEWFQFSCLNIKTINQTSILNLPSCLLFQLSFKRLWAQPDSPSCMYWSEQRNLMNCGILITSMKPVWLTSKCPHAFLK